MNGPHQADMKAGLLQRISRFAPGIETLSHYQSAWLPSDVAAFRNRIRKKINTAATPVEWIVVDASPINVIDATALGKIDELREELTAKGITINFAGVRNELAAFFKGAWAKQRNDTGGRFNFATIDAAVAAFREHLEKKPAAALDTPS